MSFMLSFFFIRLLVDIRGLHGLAGALPESLWLGLVMGFVLLLGGYCQTATSGCRLMRLL